MSQNTPASPTETERRAFQVHPNIIHDLIRRQAGTIDKAVLECVMNAIESNSTRIDVTLTKTHVSIVDNGHGFRTRDEVLAAFEVFGKSDERKAENKRFARFQLGRGQAFVFGRTTYRTNGFEMVVDINNDTQSNLGYELHEDLERVPGCHVTVELYERLTEFDINDVKKHIKRAVQYVDVATYLNGEQINIDPATEKWTDETESAYYKITKSAPKLTVYNLGVFVEETHEFGVGGILVSKRQLDLNMARNQVLRTDPVFREIKKEFRAKTTTDFLSKSSYTAEDGETLIAMFQRGDIMPWRMRTLRFLRDTNGKRRTIDELTGKTFSLDVKNSAKADKVMRTDPKIVVLDHVFAGIVFDNDAPQNDIIQLWRQTSTQFTIHEPTYVPCADLYTDLDDDITVLKPSEIDPLTNLALAEIRRFVYMALRTHYRQHRNKDMARERKLSLMNSQASEIITDGKKFILFEATLFRNLTRSLAGWNELMLRIAQSYSYDDDTKNHNLEYYERYYQYSVPFVQVVPIAFRKFVKKMLAKFPDKGGSYRNDTNALEALEPDEETDPHLDTSELGEPLDHDAEEPDDE